MISPPDDHLAAAVDSALARPGVLTLGRHHHRHQGQRHREHESHVVVSVLPCHKRVNACVTVVFYLLLRGFKIL